MQRPSPLIMPKKVAVRSVRAERDRVISRTASEPYGDKPASPLVYRSVLPIVASEQDAVFNGARACFNRWLESKKVEVQLSSGVHRVTADRTVTVTDAYDGGGRPVALRLRMRENGNDSRARGIWQTTLTAAVNRLGGFAFIGVDVEHYPAPEVGRQMASYSPPRVARELLEQFTIMDGRTRLTSVPYHVDAEDVPELYDRLRDPERSLPLVIAVEPVISNPSWYTFADRTARELAGLATLHRLSDAAMNRFNAMVGDTHAVRHGQFRRYLPDVAVNDWVDGRRHRFFMFSWLRKSDFHEKAAQTIARQPRLLSARTPQPALLSEVEFPGITDTLISVDPSPSTGTVSDVDSMLSDAAKPHLSGVFEKLRETQQQLELLERKARALEIQVQDAEQRYEHEVIDHDADASELGVLRKTVAELQRRLVEAGRSDEAYTPVETEPSPTSFDQINQLVRTSMTNLILTYDPDKAVELDDEWKGSTWAAKVWDCLSALNDYSALRRSNGFSGTFREYCSNVPPGARGYPSTRVAMVESESVRNNPRMRQERVLPVPREISRTGTVFMESHVKIDSAGATSPRVHFFDDTAGETGKVVVGYVGRHLRNTKTN